MILEEVWPVFDHVLFLLSPYITALTMYTFFHSHLSLLSVNEIVIERFINISKSIFELVRKFEVYLHNFFRVYSFPLYCVYLVSGRKIYFSLTFEIIVSICVFNVCISKLICFSMYLNIWYIWIYLVYIWKSFWRSSFVY